MYTDGRKVIDRQHFGAVRSHVPPTHPLNHLKIKNGVSTVNDLLNSSVSSLLGDWANTLSPWPKELLRYETLLYNVVSAFFTCEDLACCTLNF